MKKIIIILALIIRYNSYSQNLSVFNIDSSAFPVIKTQFYAIDANGNQITNLSASDFEIKENGILRNIIQVTCPVPKPPQALSSVLVIDVSGSMSSGGLDIAKAAANAWIDLLPLGQSECAITSFNSNNYLNQDFTTDKLKLINGINSLSCTDGTSYDAALIDPSAGGVLVAKTGKHKRVIVFLSDGGPNNEPSIAHIINEANLNNITIYCVTIGMPAPQCMKDIATQTGGLYFENIKTKEEAEICYEKILITAQGGDPCSIDWQSDFSCLDGFRKVDLQLLVNGSRSIMSYKSSYNSISKLEFNPTSIKFYYAQPGIQKDTIITVYARNADFNITNITSSNPSFTINPTSFILQSGNSINLTVSFLPADSGYNYTKFTFENNLCQTNYYASGGFPGKKPTIRTLKLLQPNGGEEFVVGMDTLITWEGVLPNEKVKIEYTTDNGLNWINISKTTTGLSYNWRVPKTPSNQCLARVTTKFGYETFFPEVQICDQIWMSTNLDVDHYRNGDSILEEQDPVKWGNLTRPAWCYYNNDPAMGAIYGKLYNWYAVYEPRGLAPEGWHIPSDSEWIELENCLGGAGSAGGKLKSTGTIEAGDGLWRSPNAGATNESGFTALPGGWRSDRGFAGIGMDGSWWSVTKDGINAAWNRYIDFSVTRFFLNSQSLKLGYSIRCVKDK